MRTQERTLPLRVLLALTTAAFITVLTEALPAGVLPAMSASLDVSESAMGQAVTIYALGTALAAIPLTRATAGWRRKRLLLTGIIGFAVANTVTAVSPDFLLTMVARFVAGMVAGLVWALLAGYARRMVPENLQGRAIAIVMAGIPLALSLGVPVGTFVGDLVGWRVTFTAMTVLAVGLIAWVIAAVPDQPGERSPMRTRAIAGVAPVLVVTFLFVLAHTILYTYIAAFLGRLGMADSTDLVLLVFGVASVASIWIVGVHIDRRLRALTVVSTALFAVAVTVLASSPAMVYVAVALWGLAWGGVPTLLQTAVAKAGDTAQAMLVTLWNVAMAGGGVLGGILLDTLGSGALPWSSLLLVVPVLAVVLGTSRELWR
jgi:predicted MFS family arabinose efflux permease